MLILYNFLFFAASEVKMDGIKFPKNLDLSRENMHAIFDAFGDGRSVTEIAIELAQVASSEKVSRPSGKASSRASKPSSHSTKSAQPSSRGGLSSKSTEQVGQGAAHSTEEVSRGKFKSPAEDKETSGTGMEIILLGDQSPEVSGESAPAPVRTEPEGSEGIPAKIGGKRPASSGKSASSPVRKKSRVATGSSPALPPIGKGKGVAADPSLPSPGNSLKTSGITSESPASAVADLLREQMFGGATEASDPRLLALTGLLASFTKEQASFQSRSREELGSSIREMLLMVSHFSPSFQFALFLFLDGCVFMLGDGPLYGGGYP